jgi:hypothetical protein
MRKVLRIILVAGTLLGLGIAHAQEAKETLVPGKVIKLEVQFEGPDGVRMKNVYASLVTDAQRPPDQAGFQNTIAGDFRQVSPGTFHVEFVIPPTVISGDYKLSSLDVRGDGIMLTYTEGQQYHLHAFHVENHAKFAQPPVTVKELH